MRSTFFIALISLLAFSPLFAAKFQIAEMEIKNQFIVMTIHSFFLDDMDVVKIINDGIEVDISYEFWVLRNTGAFLPGEVVTNFMITYNVKKDIINQGYEVNWFKEGKHKEMWYDSLDQVLYAIMNPKAVKIINIDRLSPTDSYLIETQLFATSLKLYPPLSIIYNLFGKWSYSTPKIQSGMFNKNGFFVE
ncbi:MAG: hypothetical protein A2Y33_16190 [Spirochaetes bacterium GWF1_51_8]|nr:MAG: hypothetical protein A2Y33_16190 [Spirochaetes bacterium GWF1_51_8]